MERTQLVDQIKEFFDFLTEDDIMALLDICEFKDFEPKQLVLGKNNAHKMAFFILDGSVRGYVLNDDGTEDTIMLRSKGIFIGDSYALFADSSPHFKLETLSPTKGLLFDFGKFEALAYTNKNIMNLYLSCLKDAILRLTYRVTGMITLTNEQRYQSLLEFNPHFLKDSYDKYLASYLGITPVSLSRIKKRLLEKERLEKTNES